jgi:hypothetical protein
MRKKWLYKDAGDIKCADCSPAVTAGVIIAKLAPEFRSV